MSIAGTQYQDLIDEVTRPTAWIPYQQDDTTGRQTDTPNPAMPNPLCGSYIRLDRVTTKSGQDVDVAVIRTEDARLFGVWLFDNRKGEPSVLAKVWREKDPPIGAEVALYSAPLTDGANGSYHPPRLAYREPLADAVTREPDPVAPPDAADDDIPF